MGTRTQSSWRSLLSFFSVALFSLLLLLYVGPSRNSGLDLGVPITERDLHDDTFTNLTKRATDTYEKAREKGSRLHCLMAMSIDEASEIPDGKQAGEHLQEWGIQDIEGWTEGVDKKAPYFQSYLDSAFESLGASASDAHNVHWVHNRESLIFEDLKEYSDDPEPGITSGAFFTNSYILKPGIIIADNNYAVKPALDDFVPGWEDMFKVTHIKRWSDAAWMQWVRVCDTEDGDRGNIKYIIRSHITNKTTLSILFEALINKYGASPTIGKWGDRFTIDVEANPGEFHAILGSPNGAGVGFILINHKEALGIKTVNKVEVFVPNVPYTVTGTTVDDIAQNRKIMLLFTVTSA
ncbi:hypothetical protein CEP52_004470 [Fusarium oligoseptatum]|uniref:Uncharacterized protein n=1 Tax=Fusarium oligoseptatum TaxID=2604345 RepID=A0A428U370_9HYPO|nr:hypothetical protein CEP52_004470 [Fusarium oligoseptatum]